MIGDTQSTSSAACGKCYSKKSHDFVAATGVSHTVRDFVKLTFETVGIILRFEGRGVEEVGVNVDTGTVVVRVDKQYFRPNEPTAIVGNSRKAREILGWIPTYDLRALIKEMIDSQNR